MLLVLQYQDPPHETQELKLVKDLHLPTPIAESSTLHLVTSRSMESDLSLSAVMMLL